MTAAATGCSACCPVSMLSLRVWGGGGGFAGGSFVGGGFGGGPGGGGGRRRGAPLSSPAQPPQFTIVTRHFFTFITRARQQRSRSTRVMRSVTSISSFPDGGHTVSGMVKSPPRGRLRAYQRDAYARQESRKVVASFPARGSPFEFVELLTANMNFRPRPPSDRMTPPYQSKKKL